MKTGKNKKKKKRKDDFPFAFISTAIWVLKVTHFSVCVSLGTTAVHLSWLGPRHSSVRYLATLTQGKFGQLKINVVFAEKDVKLKKKEREN